MPDHEITQIFQIRSCFNFMVLYVRKEIYTVLQEHET